MELQYQIYPYISPLNLQTIIIIYYFPGTPSFTSFQNLFTAPQPCFAPPPTNSPILSTSPFFSLFIEYYPYLNFIIPINTMTIIANTTAPNSPNMNQPIINAITEPKPIAPQFTVIAILITLRFG